MPEQHFDYVTRESALVALDYVDHSNSAGRKNDAIAMLNMARLPGVVGTEDAELDRLLIVVEAALGDIGDADREPGDDVAWCEARAAAALPALRGFMLKRGIPISGSVDVRQSDLPDPPEVTLSANYEHGVTRTMSLSNDRIIEIAETTRTAESRDGDYILPISFAREIEKEVLSMQNGRFNATQAPGLDNGAR